MASITDQDSRLATMMVRVTDQDARLIDTSESITDQDNTSRSAQHTSQSNDHG